MRLTIKESPGMFQVVESDKVHATYTFTPTTGPIKSRAEADAKLKAEAFRDGMRYLLGLIPKISRSKPKAYRKSGSMK